MIETAAPSPRRAAAPINARALALLAALALAVAALLILACPASARTTEPGCSGRGGAVMDGAWPDNRSAQATHRPGGGSTFGSADIGDSDGVTAAELGLPHAAPDAVWSRWVGAVDYAPTPGIAPASLISGSPHRPPRAA